ncbi:MAG: MBL fold metallo-hydrolase [Planctomycetota bacterium]
MAYLAGRRVARIDSFHAVFVYFEHPSAGPCLIDTGYGPAFWEASRQIPERLYRWVTPVTLPSYGTAAGILQAHQLDPRGIRHLFVSHFHADHVGGLGEFATARYVYRTGALSLLRKLGRWRQLDHAFLEGLLPADFEQRGEGLTDAQFSSSGALLQGFKAFDYFGDGSMLLVDLPGHAIGHTGFLWHGVEGPTFYIVDACWDVSVMLSRRPLPWISRKFQQDWPAYEQTQSRLSALAADVQLLACHCPRTQDHVSATPD